VEGTWRPNKQRVGTSADEPAALPEAA
jgi:hypothetical protein